MKNTGKFLIWMQIVISLLLMVVLAFSAFDESILDLIDIRWWTLFILVNLYSARLWKDLDDHTKN